MKTFLSIDWDFFVNATTYQREIMFPQGDYEMYPSEMKKTIWDDCYRRFPSWLFRIDVSSEYLSKVKRILLKNPVETVVAESHEHIYDYIMERTESDEEFMVLNIDYHHDLYHFRFGGERVNCSNWATVLFEDRPNMRMKWVRRKNSQMNTLAGEAPVPSLGILQLSEGMKFDHIFICRSDVWSPPHLDPLFTELTSVLPVRYLDDYVRTERSVPKEIKR